MRSRDAKAPVAQDMGLETWYVEFGHFDRWPIIDLLVDRIFTKNVKIEPTIHLQPTLSII